MGEMQEEAVVRGLIEDIEQKRTLMLNLVASMEQCLQQLKENNHVAHKNDYADDRHTESMTNHVFRDSNSVQRNQIAGEDISHFVMKNLRNDISTAIPQLHILQRTLVNGVEGQEAENPSTQRKAYPQNSSEPKQAEWPLNAEEYKRYARQLILPEICLEGQLRLKSASVLIVGVGGLGCPAAAYLAGAGIGRLGLVDGDEVETSNLHRQILHSSRKVGMSKVDSAIDYLRDLNPLIQLVPHREPITPSTALSLLSSYDLILDCTDNPATRYLISDACVLLQKPLVSASALRTDGQLMVLNNPPLPAGEAGGGPCYRCIFPKPPPAETVVSCGEGGILGPVVGVMGVLQALEAIKLISAGITSAEATITAKADGHTSPSTSSLPQPLQPTMLIFSGTSQPPFRHIRLRSRRAKCASCSTTASVTADSLDSGTLDYIQFCGAALPVDILSREEILSAKEYAWKTSSTTSDNEMHVSDPIVVDVRPAPHFSIYSLPGSINVPFTDLSRWTNKSGLPGELTSLIDESEKQASCQTSRETWPRPIHVICARGNDSQHAVRQLKALGLDSNGSRFIGHIEGGWKALRKESIVNGEHQWPDI